MLQQILTAIENGDPQAAEQLLPLVYEELRNLAAHKLVAEEAGQTLQPTALVHEAYLRLAGPGTSPEWNGRGHFFAAAAEAMRRILIERARSKNRLKRGAGRKRLDLHLLEVADEGTPECLLALNDALERLEQEVFEAAQVVKLRYFAGLTIEEAAAALGISIRTANRHWAYARAWLFQRLSS
jgi:RNA polymerase sigma factor (TIGR02999 family)